MITWIREQYAKWQLKRFQKNVLQAAWKARLDTTWMATEWEESDLFGFAGSAFDKADRFPLEVVSWSTLPGHVAPLWRRINVEHIEWLAINGQRHGTDYMMTSRIRRLEEIGEHETQHLVRFTPEAKATAMLFKLTFGGVK